MEPGLIVPLFGSMESDHALLCARAAARTLGGRLVLLRPVPDRAPGVRRADVEQATLHLERLAQELADEGIIAETWVRRTEPAVAIRDAVLDFAASAVVRASFKRHDLDGWLRAAIVDEVTRAIPAPTLVVPACSVPAPGARLRVLVPLDGSAVAESALVQVVGMARVRPVSVQLVQVVRLELGHFGASLPSLPHPDTAHRATTRYLHDLAATLRAAGVEAQTEVVKSPDSVATVLLDLAKRSGVEVIAMTTHGLNTGSPLRLGSVTADVMEQSPVPVLLVPGHAGMQATSARSA